MDLFVADLNMERAGFEKDRHREAIVAENETDAMQSEVGFSRLAPRRRERGFFMI